MTHPLVCGGEGLTLSEFYLCEEGVRVGCLGQVRELLEHKVVQGTTHHFMLLPELGVALHLVLLVTQTQ